MSMPPKPAISDVDYWRNRVEEARALAERMNDPHTKALMLGIAESYEKIAKWVEASAPKQP